MRAAHSAEEFCTGPNAARFPDTCRRKRADAEKQLNSPFLAQNLEYDDDTHSFSKADNPRKDPFLSSWIWLLFKILWRENVRESAETSSTHATFGPPLGFLCTRVATRRQIIPKKHDSSDSKQELALKRDNGPQNTREECTLT